jgi:hypothetical protein
VKDTTINLIDIIFLVGVLKIVNRYLDNNVKSRSL